MKSIRASLIVFCIIVIRYVATTKHLEWLDDFRNYITKNNTEYQLMLLFERNEKLDSKVNNILCSISEKFPTVKISFQDATYKKSEELNKLPLFSSPRITIVVIIHLSKESGYLLQLSGPIELVSQLSEPRRRSRLLIILPEEQEVLTYVKILRRLWFKQFLDVTILELIEEETEKKRNFLTSSKDIAMIHQYNPFTEKYVKIRYAPSVSWFPDKTKNLNGYRMKVGLFDYPPFVFVERDAAGTLTKVFGSDVQLANELSKAINFSMKWIFPKNGSTWGDSECSKEESTGLARKIMNSEIEFITAQSGRYSSCDERLFEWSRGTDIVKLVMIVHISQDKSVQLLVTWKKFNTLMLVSLFLLIWILSRLLQLDRDTWSFLTIMQLVFGFTPPREPQNLTERIIFGTTLISCLLYSSLIYTALTDVGLAVSSERVLKTVDQVIASPFKTIIPSGMYVSLIAKAEGSQKVLLSNPVIVVDNRMCVAHLLKEKNGVCITRSDIAHWVIENNKNSYGQPILKIVDESLTFNPTGLVLKARSPYVERFDNVLLRLIQSGVVKKWQQPRFRGFINANSTISIFKRGSESRLLQKQVICTLLVGYVIALVAFFCEVLSICFKKSTRGIHNCMKIKF